MKIRLIVMCLNLNFQIVPSYHVITSKCLFLSGKHGNHVVEKYLDFLGVAGPKNPFKQMRVDERVVSVHESYLMIFSGKDT